MLLILFIVGLSLIIYGLILSYWTLKKNHGFIVYLDKGQYRVYLIHLDTLDFFETEVFDEIPLFRFNLKSWFYYLMYQFDNETSSTDLLEIFKKQQEKDR